MPEFVEARRENATELYIEHDTGSVVEHFRNRTTDEPRYRDAISKVIAFCSGSAKYKQSIPSLYFDEDSDC